MKSKEKISKSRKKLKNLSLSIGDFIRYWGFRRVHGAIWTQLYLSKKPLSCTDLTRNLELSKSLISPALDELCSYKLIQEAPAPNEKTKVYEAAENVDDVIKLILRTRESKILNQISKNFASFKETEAESVDNFDKNRVHSLEEMILSATIILDLLISQKNLKNFQAELEN
jgi:DNA-binding transcriptional regulator GbsR (MarR family)